MIKLLFSSIERRLKEKKRLKKISDDMDTFGIQFGGANEPKLKKIEKIEKIEKTLKNQKNRKKMTKKTEKNKEEKDK